MIYELNFCSSVFCGTRRRPSSVITRERSIRDTAFSIRIVDKSGQASARNDTHCFLCWLSRRFSEDSRESAVGLSGALSDFNGVPYTSPPPGWRVCSYGERRHNSRVPLGGVVLIRDGSERVSNIKFLLGLATEIQICILRGSVPALEEENRQTTTGRPKILLRNLQACTRLMTMLRTENKFFLQIWN